MSSRLLATISIAALALAACGGDDDGGGDGGGGGGDGSPQDQVADMMMEVLDETMTGEEMEGVTVDEDCIRDKIGGLSDDDAQKILDAGPEGDPDVSDGADEISASIVECVDMDLSSVGGDG
jgi:hypothetical protein